MSETGHSRVYEQSWKKPRSQAAFRYGFHPHPECKGETEKMIEEIVARQSEESVPEDTVEQCHKGRENIEIARSLNLF